MGMSHGAGPERFESERRLVIMADHAIVRFRLPQASSSSLLRPEA